MGRLKELRPYIHRLPEGSVVILPILKGRRPFYGSTVDFDVRIHRKGVIGPSEFNRQNLEDIGGTPALYESALKLVEHLRSVFAPLFKYEEETPIGEKEEKKPAEAAVEILAK